MPPPAAPGNDPVKVAMMLEQHRAERALLEAAFLSARSLLNIEPATDAEGSPHELAGRGQPTPGTKFSPGRILEMAPQLYDGTTAAGLGLWPEPLPPSVVPDEEPHSAASAVEEPFEMPSLIQQAPEIQHVPSPIPSSTASPARGHGHPFVRACATGSPPPVAAASTAASATTSAAFEARSALCAGPRVCQCAQPNRTHFYTTDL